MIDLFTVFHRGGVVLYERQLQAVPGHPVDSLISNVLLEERVGGAQSYRHEEKYTVKWTFANDLDLVFVAVYLNLTNLLYLDDLLVAAKDKFCSLFRDQIKADADSSAYTKKFNRIYDDLVFSYETGATKASGALPSAMPASDTIASPKKPQHSLSNKKAKADTPAAESTDDAPLFEQSTVPAAATPDKQAAAAASSPSSDAPAVNQTKLAALQAAARTGKPVHSFGKKKKGDAAAANTPEKKEPEAPAKKAKVARTWDGNKATKKEAAELDYAVKRDGDAGKSGESVISGFDSANKEGNQDAYKHVEQKSYSDDEEEEEDQAEEEEDDSSSSSSSSKSGGGGGGGFFSFIKTLVAGKVLERSDLEPVLAAMKENLNGKNVAAEISEQLAESVIKTLEGQKLASFTSVKSMVRKAVEAALTRILTPNRQIDVLAGVAEANEQKRPYSIVFVGVNGVGKSTSLAKTASYFLTKGLTVGVGACDTFRAGAIEQLRTHTKALEIPLYARGYDRDAASVAQDAISQARHDGLNVVLIDTAGRMQHNEPLMRALAKLITLNKPDLVLFVGEALVGNDAVDQVKEFNRSLSDMSDEKKPRLIDGIILTKFDTIDDKVGAAISMAHVTGQPILFVGTGQTYADLKRMNVKTLIRSLLK